MTIEPGLSHVASPLRAFTAVALQLGALLTLSACVSTGSPESDLPPGYVYRQHLSFVRVERIEAGASANGHPFGVSTEALAQPLRSVQVEGSISPNAVPMFTRAEVEETAPHLAAALAKAGPGEDVTFAVVGQHGLLGSLSSRSITTGRVFVRDGQLNVIFGLVQDLYEHGELRGAEAQPPTGSRTYRPGKLWKLAPGSGRLADKRSDWVMFDAPAPAAKVGEPAAPAAPGADKRYTEIESRLNALNRLKANGLITEEEYAERRRAILQGL